MKEITHYAYLQGEVDGMLVKHKDGSGAVVWQGQRIEHMTSTELEDFNGAQPVYEINDKAIAELIKLTR